MAPKLKPADVAKETSAGASEVEQSPATEAEVEQSPVAAAVAAHIEQSAAARGPVKVRFSQTQSLVVGTSLLTVRAGDVRLMWPRQVETLKRTGVQFEEVK